MKLSRPTNKMPQEWGGTNKVENLQPLCEECNREEGKIFATFSEHAERIRHAIANDEPHRRIGELLKAFQGERVRTDLIGIVASAQQYQEDYQKRLRELRTLGWKIKVSRRVEDGRHRAYYTLVEAPPPWPAGASERRSGDASGRTSASQASRDATRHIALQVVLPHPNHCNPPAPQLTGHPAIASHVARELGPQ